MKPGKTPASWRLLPLFDAAKRDLQPVDVAFELEISRTYASSLCSWFAALGDLERTAVGYYRRATAPTGPRAEVAP